MLLDVMNQSNEEIPPEDRERQYDEFVGLLSRHDLAIRRFVRSLLPSQDGVDHLVDPNETKNIAKQKPDVLLRLTRQLDAGWKAALNQTTASRARK